MGITMGFSAEREQLLAAALVVGGVAVLGLLAWGLLAKGQDDGRER